MTPNQYRETYVLKLGGSLMVPAGGIATAYLRQFKEFIRTQVAANQRCFFILVGGAALDNLAQALDGASFVGTTIA